MARYINLDEAIKYLHNDCKAKYPLSYANGLSASINELSKLPTADVVPKSEVEALECEIARLRNSILPSYYQACSEEEAIKIGKEYGKQEVAREIFEEIEKILIDSAYIPDCARFVDIDKLAELKKKYTEGET